MVELERPRRRPPILAAVLLVVLLAVAGFYLAAPRVVSFSPPAGAADVSRSAAIEITFNQAMAQQSVETRLQIEPALSGNFEWRGSTLRFEPQGGWPEGGQVRVELQGGARSAYMLPQLGGEIWAFTVARPRLLYLSPAEGSAQLMVHGLQQQSGRPLLDDAPAVVDYDLAADGATLAYIVAGPGARNFLFRQELDGGEAIELFECPAEARCQQVELSLDDEWAALEAERLTISATGVQQSAGRQVWLLATEPGAEPLVLGSQGAETHTPRWTTRNRLGYYDSGAGQVIVVEPGAAGQWRQLAALDHPLGESWAWSPDGRFIVLPQVELFDEPTAEGVDFYSHLIRVEVETGLRTDLSGGPGALVEDAAPAYSPDGLWIAFARKSLRPADWTPGRQLWLMRADGSDARPLTNAPNYNHASFTWNQSGSRMAFVRFLQVALDQPPEVWWLDMETEDREMLVQGGYEPQWMP